MFESVQYSNHVLLLEIQMFVKAINIIKTNFSAINMLVTQYKDRSKPVQHFIQHHVLAMLDEMLEWFAQL